MHATAKSATHLSFSDPRGHFTMLLAISVPIMALYAADAIDYTNMLLKDRPTEVSVEIAAPAQMASAVKKGAKLLDTPELASYATPRDPEQIQPGKTTLAYAAAGASLASY